MKLYWATLSPFVRKVMIVAHEVGHADKLILANTAVGMTKPNAVLMEDNPLNKIPTLLLDDGTALYDSGRSASFSTRISAAGGSFLPVRHAGTRCNVNRWATA